MPTILVVDDDPDVMALASHVLAMDGHQVLTAASGEAALDLLRRPDRVDLILTDLVMPGIDGFELVARAKQDRAELRAVYMSGFYRTLPRVPSIHDRPVDVLRKPWRIHELKSAITASLNAPPG